MMSLRLARTLARLPRPAHFAGPTAAARRYASDGGPSTRTKQPDHPAPTQGHTTQKSHNLDVQNQSANKGQAESAKAGGTGGGQPFDAARMSGAGGERKGGAEGTGPFKDQVGGQEGGAGRMGGKEETAGGSTGDMVKKALGVGKDKRHESVMSPQKGQTQRQLHTTSLAWATQPDGSRQPKEKGLQGDQNEHLKHTSSPGSEERKGNAADEPHLPSKSGNTNTSSAGGKGGGAAAASNPAQSGKASGAVKGFSALHTSARAWKEGAAPKAGYVGSHTDEPAKAGYDTPPEALPPNLESTYNRAEANPPPPPNQTPSSAAQYSSTAQDPPNQALADVVKGGGQAGGERNPQPTGEVGKQGLGEAWKNRKA